MEPWCEEGMAVGMMISRATWQWPNSLALAPLWLGSKHLGCPPPRGPAPRLGLFWQSALTSCCQRGKHIPSPWVPVHRNCVKAYTIRAPTQPGLRESSLELWWFSDDLQLSVLLLLTGSWIPTHLCYLIVQAIYISCISFLCSFSNPWEPWRIKHYILLFLLWEGS